MVIPPVAWVTRGDKIYLTTPQEIPPLHGAPAPARPKRVARPALPLHGAPTRIL